MAITAINSESPVFNSNLLGGLHVEDNVQAVQEYDDIKENNQQPSQFSYKFIKNELMHE